MPSYGTIRKELSKIVGDEQAPILRELDACLHELKCAPAVSVERAPTVVRVPDTAAEAEVRRLRAQLVQVQDTRDAERRDLEAHIAAVEHDNNTIENSITCGLVSAGLMYGGVVGALLTSRLIEKDVKKPGSRLLVIRNLRRPPRGEQFDPSGFECAGSLEICDGDTDFFKLLSAEEEGSRLNVFGCGSGFVTDYCFCTFAITARADMAATVAMIKSVKTNIEIMARGGWVRTKGKDVLAWRPSE